MDKEPVQKGDKMPNEKFEWDVSTPKKYVYSCQSSVCSTDGNSVFKEYDSLECDILIQIKRFGLSDLIATNINYKEVKINTETDSIKEESGVREDVVFLSNVDLNSDVDTSEFNPSNDFLFPLPQMDLKIGEIDIIHKKYGVRYLAQLDDSVTFSTGTMSLRFVGFDSIDNIKCAVLEVLINISKLNTSVDTLFEKDIECSVFGRGTYYFDLKEHCYVGADFTTTTINHYYEKCKVEENERRIKQYKNDIEEWKHKEIMLLLNPIPTIMTFYTSRQQVSRTKIRLKEIIEN